MIDCFDKLSFSRGLEAVWNFIAAIDKFIVEREPWRLAKETEGNAQQLLDETLYTSAEALRVICGLLYPVMPDSTAKIWAQLSMPEPIQNTRLADLHWGRLSAGQQIGPVSPVYPRFELKPTVERIQELEVLEKARQDEVMGKKPAPA